MTITADAWTLLSNETRKNGANEYTFLYDNLFCEPDKIIILTAKNTFEKKNIDLRHDNCLRVNWEIFPTVSLKEFKIGTIPKNQIQQRNRKINQQLDTTCDCTNKIYVRMLFYWEEGPARRI